MQISGGAGTSKTSSSRKKRCGRLVPQSHCANSGKSLAWTVEIGNVAERQLRKLDPQVERRILDWLHERIEGGKNPRHFGEALKGERAGLWRYRVGDYR